MFKKKLNKKGATAIEVVISIMMMLLLLSFMIDLLAVIWKHSVVSQVNTEVSRIVGIQGGLLNSAPEGYPGGNENYLSASEVTQLLDNKFASAGVSGDKWKVKVGSGTLGKDGIAEAKYDYLTTFTVEVNIDYEWEYISKMIPGQITQTIVSKRPAMSEWKYGYNDWIGE